MLVEQDQPLSEASPSAGEPRVFVVYKSRGVPWLLLPPLLILSSVAAIVVYRRSERPEPPPTEAAAAAAASVVLPSATPTSIPEPSGAAGAGGSKVTDTKPVNIETAPAQSQIVALTAPAATTSPLPSSGQPSTPTVPFDPAPPVVAKTEQPPATIPAPPPERVGFDPGAFQVANGPTLPPTPDEPRIAERPPLLESPRMVIVEKPVVAAIPPLIPSFVMVPEAKAAPVDKPRTEDVRADIKRDADNQAARRRELEALKPELLRGNSRVRQAEREEIAATARRQEAEKREPFHVELRQILKEQGRNGGREIQALCERFGKDYPPEIFVPLSRDLTGPAARLTVPARVDRMRRWGLPEPVILDDLYLKEEILVNSPGGPRTRDEAWVFAARRLLTMPPPPAPPRPGAEPAAQPPREPVPR